MNLLRQIGLMKPEGSSRRRGLVGIGAAAADYFGVDVDNRKCLVTGILSTPAVWVIKFFTIIHSRRAPFIPRCIATKAASFRDARFVDARAVLATGRKPVAIGNTRANVRSTLPVFAVASSQISYILTRFSVWRGTLMITASAVFAIGKRIYTRAIATGTARAATAVYLGNGIDAALSRRTRGNALPVHADVFSSTGPTANAANRVLSTDSTVTGIGLFSRAASGSTPGTAGHISTPGSAATGGHVRTARSASATAGRLGSASSAACRALALLFKDSVFRTGLGAGLVVRAGAGSSFIRGTGDRSGIAASRDADAEVRTTGQALVAGSIGKAFAPLFSVGARGLLLAVAPAAKSGTNACPSQNQIRKGTSNFPTRFRIIVAHSRPPTRQSSHENAMLASHHGKFSKIGGEHVISSEARNLEMPTGQDGRNDKSVMKEISPFGRNDKREISRRRRLLEMTEDDGRNDGGASYVIGNREPSIVKEISPFGRNDKREISRRRWLLEMTEDDGRNDRGASYVISTEGRDLIPIRPMSSVRSLSSVQPSSSVTENTHHYPNNEAYA
jgi:hypothetical protein